MHNRLVFSFERETMLQIKELSILHRKDLRVIVEDFHLALHEGDKAVIIGEEGNGKSTLLKWIYDPKLIDSYGEARGERLTGKERLGYLPQELPESDENKSVYEYFSEEETFWNHTTRELAAMTGKFHVEPEFFYRSQKMKTLSGGEKVKAQMMKILLQEPTVLLLDEPSNDIDLETLEMLEKLIGGWKYIVLFISHDETLIENTATMVIHLEQIRRKTKSRYTVARMPYQEYLTQRRQNFRNQEQRAITDKKEQKRREEKYRKLYQRVEHAQASVSRQNPAASKNLKDKMHTVLSVRRRFDREDENMTELPEQEEAIYFRLGGDGSRMPWGKTVVEYRLSTLCIPGEQEASRLLARNIHLLVRGPEKVCIVGENGAGKTTLLKKIAQELMKRTDIRAEYMPQNYEDILDQEQTPAEFLNQSGEKEERTRIQTYLGSLKFTADEMNHPIRDLSGGQKAKVLLLKLSLSDANVLILDEPTRNVSPLSGPVIRKMIREFPGAVISISHDRKYIREVCDYVYQLTPEGLCRKTGDSGCRMYDEMV